MADTMIKSMTGFGRCEQSEGTRTITIEMKSVNHRYLEAGIKMPKKLNIFEARMREVLKKYAQRGKIDIFISYEDTADSNVHLKYNSDLAAEYMNILDSMAEQFGKQNDITITSLSRYPEVITMQEETEDEEELWAFISKALENACSQFEQTRILEGTNLKNDLQDKLNHMEELVDFIESRSPQIMKEYRSKLENKVTQLLGDTQIDENLLATEIVMFSDKICVDEEMVRLRTHVEHVKETLAAGENIGRKLDFLIQEMNREANTTLSKANDSEVSEYGIDLKTEIEKIREQIQNIE